VPAMTRFPSYKWREEKVTYGEIQQRWLIVESEKRKKSDYEKLELKLKQEEKQIEKRIQKLGKEKFADLKTAQEHLKTIESSLKL
jgi:transposase